MKTETLKIKGMTCMGCVGSVKQVLESVPGVSTVNVSLEQGLAIVDYDAARTDPARLGAAVEEAGFEVG